MQVSHTSLRVRVCVCVCTGLYYIVGEMYTQMSPQAKWINEHPKLCLFLLFFENVKCRLFFVCVMSRFRGTVGVRGDNIQSVQYKNHYAYGESPQR